MCEKKKLQFECRSCGSPEFSYHKYVKCVTPVSLQENGHMEYGQSIFDEDDYLTILNGFACTSCGSLIEHCGIRIQTEKELLDYLSMNPDVRQQQQSEYEEHMSAQSEQERDAWVLEEMLAAEKLAQAD